MADQVKQREHPEIKKGMKGYSNGWVDPEAFVPTPEFIAQQHSEAKAAQLKHAEAVKPAGNKVNA